MTIYIQRCAEKKMAISGGNSDFPSSSGIYYSGYSRGESDSVTV